MVRPDRRELYGSQVGVLAALASLALLLTAVGIHGLLAFTVAQRPRARRAPSCSTGGSDHVRSRGVALFRGRRAGMSTSCRPRSAYRSDFRAQGRRSSLPSGSAFTTRVARWRCAITSLFEIIYGPIQRSPASLPT